VINTATNPNMVTVSLNAPTGVDVSPNGTQLYVAAGDDTMSVISLAPPAPNV